jgi:hypothetical protein
MRARATNVAASILLLAVGSLIYALWRSHSLLMFRWFDAVGIGPLIDRSRGYVHFIHVADWIRYSLPDALWASSGVFLFSAIWTGSRSPVRHFWICIAPCLAIGGELAQAVHLIPGTFDLVDLATCALLSGASVALTCRPYHYVRPC